MAVSRVASENQSVAKKPGKGSAYLIAGLLAMALVAALVMQIARGTAGPEAPVAKVTSYGEVVALLPLNVDYRQTIECDEGVNTVVVEGGAVHIEDADCSGGDCMRQGTIQDAGQLLVCLPHQLIVEIVPAGGSSSSNPSVYTGNEIVGAEDRPVDTVAR